MPINSTYSLAEPAPELRAVPSAGDPKRAPSMRGARMVEAALLIVAAIFFALHYVHLTADFPDHSPWMDWAK